MARPQLRIALVRAVSDAGHRPTLERTIDELEPALQRARWRIDRHSGRARWMLANMTDRDLFSGAAPRIIRAGVAQAGIARVTS